MTQLFDTATYDASENCPAPASTPLPRLLHAVSTTPDPQLSAQWRLDDSTIEIGRRGIAMARAALRDINRPSGRSSVASPAPSPTAPASTASDTDETSSDQPARKAA